MKSDARKKSIIRAGIIGILANIILAVFKLIAGLLAGSIVFVLDAVNNSTDVLSSLVTVIGARLAGKPADRMHPLGHGRIEYLSAQFIAALILYAGLASFVASVRRIITPETPDFGWANLVIIIVSIAVKLFLGFYFRKKGIALRSEALKNSGSDAFSDVLISSAALVSVLVFMFSGVNLEGWLGILISAFIIRAAVKMYWETSSKIVGERADSELSGSVRKSIADSDPRICGVYDLMLISCGPDQWIGSVNIGVPAGCRAEEIDVLSRNVSKITEERFGITLTSIGIHAVPGEVDNELTAKLEKIAAKTGGVKQIHGAVIDRENKRLRFDAVPDFSAGDPEKICAGLRAEAEKEFPGYEIAVNAGRDYTD